MADTELRGRLISVLAAVNGAERAISVPGLVVADQDRGTISHALARLANLEAYGVRAKAPTDAFAPDFPAPEGYQGAWPEPPTDPNPAATEADDDGSAHESAR